MLAQSGVREGEPGILALDEFQRFRTIDKKRKLEMEFEVKVGRGFCPGDENKKPDQPIGVIAITRAPGWMIGPPAERL